MMPTEAQQTELTNYEQVLAALAIGPVFCDIATPAAAGLPVRDVRKFKRDKAIERLGQSIDEWTSKYFQGKQKGFEVEVLEGWRVPERVYTEKVIA